MPQDNTPIEQLRRLASWANRTSEERAKVAIVTNADRMGDSSRNALLKLLEDPPPRTYLILVTTAKAALLPTIRSRLRSFRFRERSDSEAREVLERIFHEESGEYATLREYFLAWHISPEILRNEGSLFLHAVVSGTPQSFFEGNRDLEAIIKDREVFHAFMEELIHVAAARSRDTFGGERGSRVDGVVRLDAWGNAIRSAFDRVRRYNMNPGTALEALFYRMREAL